MGKYRVSGKIVSKKYYPKSIAIVGNAIPLKNSYRFQYNCIIKNDAFVVISPDTSKIDTKGYYRNGIHDCVPFLNNSSIANQGYSIYDLPKIKYFRRSFYDDSFKKDIEDKLEKIKEPVLNFSKSFNRLSS